MASMIKERLRKRTDDATLSVGARHDDGMTSGMSVSRAESKRAVPWVGWDCSEWASGTASNAALLSTLKAQRKQRRAAMVSSDKG